MKFSIVVTSTRPHLLEFSLRSALAQTFDDYEIVVSDNSIEGCRDLITALGGDRVRYVRPDSPMTLTAHWNFAFSHARGDWHLQLCDDDAITPNLLASLDKAVNETDADTISWNYGAYYGDARREGGQGFSRLTFGQMSGRMTRYESAPLLAEMFASGTGLFRIKHKVPFFPRMACRREILDAIRGRQGQLFHPFCPMTSGAAAVLAFTRSTLHLDLPLMLLGMTVDSCGGWSTDPTTIDASHAGVAVELAPIRAFRVLPTAMADALLRTQRAMPDMLGQYDLNYANYFLHCHLFLCTFEERGFDSAAHRRVFNDALMGMPPDVQEAVRAVIEAESKPATQGHYLRAKRLLRSMVDRLRAPREPGEVDAARLGLGNIFDCAAYVGALIERRLGAKMAAE
jgi:hypothetical protein